MAAKRKQFYLLLTVTLIKASYCVIITPNNEVSQILQKDGGTENPSRTFIMNTPITRLRSFSNNISPNYIPAPGNTIIQNSNYNSQSMAYSPVNSNYSPQDSNTVSQNTNNNQQTITENNPQISNYNPQSVAYNPVNSNYISQISNTVSQNSNNNQQFMETIPQNTNDIPSTSNEYTSLTQTQTNSKYIPQNINYNPQTNNYNPVNSNYCPQNSYTGQHNFNNNPQNNNDIPNNEYSSTLQREINPLYPQLENIPIIGAQKLIPNSRSLYSNPEELIVVNNGVFKPQAIPSEFTSNQRVAVVNNQEPINEKIIGYLIRDLPACPNLPSSSESIVSYPSTMMQIQSPTPIETDPPIIVVEEESSYQDILNMMLFKMLRDKTQNSPHRISDRCYDDHNFEYFPQKYPYSRILSEILNN